MAAPATRRLLLAAGPPRQLLRTLGLDGCADVRVGGATSKGLSGGQQKRLSIATELVNRPSALFLDEVGCSRPALDRRETLPIKAIASS